MDDKIKKNGPAKDIDTVKEIGGQLVSGLRYLHQRKIIHQDFKPPNILIDDDYKTAKIIDLGVSKKQDQHALIAERLVGTVRYMAPEQQENSNFKIDIWALGCVLLEFATGITPYEDVTNEMTLD